MLPARWLNTWSWYRTACACLLVLLLGTHVAYLHRLPGLMGDEASEGENVWQIVDSQKLTVQGERSYIGPLADYVRIPFIGVFGYSALALRLPMLLASLISFLCAAALFRRWWGEVPALYALTGLCFSPVYLSQQRLGWAITLSPLFALVTLWLATRPWRHAPLLAGFIGGLGISNHILFMPTFVALVSARVVTLLPHWRRLLAWWPALLGVAAGFGTQFAVLVLNTEDQGDPAAVGELAKERWQDLPSILPLVLSGSSYVARYTGAEFSPATSWLVTGLLLLAIVPALVMRPSQRVSWLWLGGLAVHMIVLLYMIDRFSLRYFTMLVFGVWTLAGVGVGTVVARFWKTTPWRHTAGAGAVALGLAGLYSALILVPFLQTGGSVNAFSLGSRTDNAAALVDVRPLIACLAGAGSVGSENVHIWNRLWYLRHANASLDVVPEESISEAQWIVNYRTGETAAAAGERCPHLRHFSVLPAGEEHPSR